MSVLDDISKAWLTVTFKCPITGVDETFEISDPDIEIKDHDWYVAVKPGGPDLDDPKSAEIGKTVGEVIKKLFDRWGIE